MRILILTQWFDPEPTFKGLLFAKELQAAGHQVQVLTGVPNYPGGKVYPGYQIKWLQKEMMDGVEVLRVPLYPSHDNSSAKRILNYGSFMLSTLFFGLFVARQAEVMYVYHPPLTTGISAALISKLRGIPFVYDVQDLWPDTLAATGMMSKPGLLKWIDRACNWVYRQAAHIVVLSPGFKHILQERGVPEQKLSVIYNWADETQLCTEPTPEDAEAFGMAEKFNVVFAGTMGKAQALDAVIEAAGLLQPQLPRVQFVFVGGGIQVDHLKELTQQKQLQNVRFLPRMPMSEVGRVLALSDALLVHLKDDPLFRITIPSKTQAYMAVGKPVVMGVKGDAADLIEKSGGGVVCQPENPQDIARAIHALATLPAQDLRKMGLKAASYYQQELSVRSGVQRFVEVLGKHKAVRSVPLLKRLFDVLVAGVGIGLLAIPMLIIALLIRKHMGSPVIFSQVRPGLHGKPFTMYKFRTMRDARDAKGNLLSDAERITPLGQFLRRTSLDELPELWNVLKGEMSLVGPRPLLMEYLPLYSSEQARRHEALPGVTGWAQVNGRNAISWEEKFRLDVWYIQNWNFALDVKILWMTVQKVFKREGISAAGEATMARFTGSPGEHK